jgi:ubiquinone/menaquinone biosynthesis C-methylase UbiE
MKEVVERNIDDYTKVYNDNEFENIQAKFRKRIVMDFLRKYANNRSTILEIGCGSDSMFNYVSNFANFSVVDPSKEFIEKAKLDKLNHQFSDKVTLYNSYLEEAQFENKSFDIVIISGLLHEVAYPEKIMSKIKTILSSNAVLHVNVPNANSLHRIWAYESGLIKSVSEISDTQMKYQQSHTFSGETMSQLLNREGYYILESGSYFVKPFTHSQMIFLLKNKVISEVLLEGLYNLTKYMPELGSEIFFNIKIKDE